VYAKNKEKETSLIFKIVTFLRQDVTYTKVCVQQCVNRDDASLIISSKVSL
jgi:hypothetical protein